MSKLIYTDYQIKSVIRKLSVRHNFTNSMSDSVVPRLRRLLHKWLHITYALQASCPIGPVLHCHLSLSFARLHLHVFLSLANLLQ